MSLSDILNTTNEKLPGVPEQAVPSDWPGCVYGLTVLPLLAIIGTTAVGKLVERLRQSNHSRE